MQPYDGGPNHRRVRGHVCGLYLTVQDIPRVRDSEVYRKPRSSEIFFSFLFARPHKNNIHQIFVLSIP